MKIPSLLLLAALLLPAWRARAQQPCEDPLRLPNPVYLSVGDTQINLIAALGKRLRDTENTTLIWRATGSCTNLDTIYGGARMTGNFSYIPAGWDPMQAPPTCSVPAPGVPADIANSIVFLDACPASRPPTVADHLGPVQSFVFAVPTASLQTAITAEEAYFVFGFGQPGRVVPWTDESQLLIRPTTKGTILSMAASIRVPAGRWKGAPINLSQELASQLAQSPSPQSALGILGSEVYDGYRQGLRALAFRAFGQYRAYFPDATSTSFDRRNVRDGHYHMWSYTHWLDTVDQDGKPVNPRARRVIDLITSRPAQPAPSFSPEEVSIGVGLVPICAMQVRREREGGDLSPYQPEAPCACFFEKLTGGTSCAACTDDGPCGAGKCRNGLCEAR